MTVEVVKPLELDCAGWSGGKWLEMVRDGVTRRVWVRRVWVKDGVIDEKSLGEKKFNF